MSDRGWISTYRKIREHWLWKEKPFDKRSAWLDLLMEVNHEDRKIFFDGDLVTVKRGSTITSMRKLSEQWGWSIKKVSNFLNLLEKDKMLEQKRNTRCTTITIVNYDIYQGGGRTKETPKKHSGNTRETLGKTNNNDKELLITNNKKDMSPSAEKDLKDLPAGAELLPDGTVSYANVKRNWD